MVVELASGGQRAAGGFGWGWIFKFFVLFEFGWISKFLLFWSFFV
jgi:hypothetical protein